MSTRSEEDQITFSHNGSCSCDFSFHNHNLLVLKLLLLHIIVTFLILLLFNIQPFKMGNGSVLLCKNKDRIKKKVYWTYSYNQRPLHEPFFTRIKMLIGNLSAITSMRQCYVRIVSNQVETDRWWYILSGKVLICPLSCFAGIG